ncbi:MAG: efflux RND transporter periplasmic adaptor subunit [Opitutae bacterium]|nr:efflux RND transporter periplasmic adaptor subunit [Opitutae bacterium]
MSACEQTARQKRGAHGSSYFLRPLAALVQAFCLGIIFFAHAPAAETAETVRAQLSARRFAAISAEVAAKINRMHVPEGGAFQSGDVLVSFDATLQAAQVERAQAVLSAAEKTASANQRLLKLQSVGQVEAELSEAEVRKARAELAYAQAMLAKCQIKAPFPGRVAEQRAHDQEFVQVGQSLLEIIDDAMPQIDFIAPSKWLAWLQVGQSLQVRIDETGKTYAAKIERLGARADPVSQSVKIVAGVVGTHPELIAGMSGTILIAPETKP